MLDRYLIREVLKPSIMVCLLFIVLFAGYSWIVFLAKAVDALLSTSMLLKLIVLKVGIALEVLLPVSLYFGIILGLGRLHSDSEMKAFLASGDDFSAFRMCGDSCVRVFIVSSPISL
jgi:lipopolysaccharide export system permease protein